MNRGVLSRSSVPCPGRPLPRDTDAGCGGAVLLPVGISNCFLKRARLNGTVGIYSGNLRTSSARLSEARFSWDGSWRTPRTCCYPLWKASRYLLGFVRMFKPHQIHFPLGGFWHDSCFPFGAGAEDGRGTCAEHPSRPAAFAGRWRRCQLTSQTRHALLGFLIGAPQC